MERIQLAFKKIVVELRFILVFFFPLQKSGQSPLPLDTWWLQWEEKLSLAANCPHHKVQSTWRYNGLGVTVPILFTFTEVAMKWMKKLPQNMWIAQSLWKQPLERVKWLSDFIISVFLMMDHTIVHLKMVTSVMLPA